MNRSGNKIKPDTYQNWLKRPATERLLALEADWLRDTISAFRGLHLAYAGIDPTPHFLEASRCHHVFRMAFPWQKGRVSRALDCKDSHWPLADESLDVVVLQHCLDMTRRPHQLIREACRCLVPNGYLVVVGFNPWSLWGVGRLAHAFSSELPWVANPVAYNRLKDWLILLDSQVEQVRHVEHLWPLRLFSERLSRRFDRVAANRSWLPGNGYLLISRKTIAGMTPIREKRWRHTHPGFTMPAPAVRQPQLRDDCNT
ncbi:methyltransferase domain-containing protein [Bacterioplanoides sp.]|uniref:methyltransferase domain-containing protein n=1 Tax=Bacterioplanoides sp. TaxID=2066072 RepID=UPI003B003DF4